MPDGQSDRGKDGGGAADTLADLLRRTLASLISGTSANSNREKVGVWRYLEEDIGSWWYSQNFFTCVINWLS